MNIPSSSKPQPVTESPFSTKVKIYFSIGGSLLLTVAVAAFFIHVTIENQLRYKLRVVNQSGIPIESFLVSGPGIRLDLGPIASNGQVLHRLDFSSDGSLHFSAELGDKKFSDEIEGYVTGNLGGNTTIKIHPGHSYEINKKVGYWY